MSSGKQTSFQFGEISEKNQYGNNDAMYSTALSKLTNFKVLRAGGVERWPGLKLVGTSGFQNNAPTLEIDYQRFKSFSYTVFSSSLGRDISETITFRIPDNANSDEVDIRVAGVTIPHSSSNLVVDSGKGLREVKVIQRGKRLIIHGLKLPFAGGIYSTPLEIVDVTASTILVNGVTPPAISSFSTPSTFAASIAQTVPVEAPAVEYLVMADHRIYGEQSFARFKTAATPSGLGFYVVPSPWTDLAFPGGVFGIQTALTHDRVTTEEYLSYIKNFNVYRASRTNNTTVSAAFELVYRFSVDPSLVTYPINISPPLPRTVRIEFIDTGVGDPSIAPALDFSMYVNDGSNSVMAGTSCSAFYQDRHFVAFSENINQQLGPGDVTVSALGAPLGFARPTVLRAAGAFGFSIPSDDGSPVRHMINAERLLAFTDNASYVIQGGEQGIITPFEINPTKITNEGVSRYVRPLVINNSVFYVNSTHKKLIRIVYGAESITSINEVSIFSDDIMDGRDIIEMVEMPGSEDTLLLLRQDGSLIMVTISESGVGGFSRVDLGDLKIETMVISGASEDQVLTLTGIQNGIRAVYTINQGEVQNGIRTQAYTNSATQYGERIARLTDSGYVKVSSFDDTDIQITDYEKIETLNISAADYTAGQTLTITSSVRLETDSAQYSIYDSYDQTLDRIKYLFDDDNGNETFLLINIDPSSVSGSGPYTYSAVADIDIPTAHQDVANKGYSQAQTLAFQTRWLRASKRVQESSSALGIWALYLLLQEGADATPTTPDGAVDVAVRADGVVYSSPLNPNLSPNLQIVKAAGVTEPYLDLPDFVSFVEVGVPFESTLESLPIERGGNTTLSDHRKIVDKVGIAVYNTIGGFVGKAGEADIRNLAPMITRQDVDNLASASQEFTGYLSPIIPGEWTDEGKIKVTQVDPSPMTILSIYPKGMIGD